MNDTFLWEANGYKRALALRNARQIIVFDVNVWYMCNSDVLSTLATFYYVLLVFNQPTFPDVTLGEIRCSTGLPKNLYGLLV